MDIGVPGLSGLLGSLRGFADGVFGSVQDRLELLSADLHEEKQRLIQTLIWVLAAVFCALLAIAFASAALVAACWETRARIPVIIGLAVCYGIGALVACLKARRMGERRPFSATIARFEADRRRLF